MSTNIAVALSQLGYRVCLFDSRFEFDSYMLTGSISSIEDMQSVIDGQCSIESLIESGPNGISVIPYQREIDEYSNLSVEQKQYFLLAITQLQHHFDYLLLDTQAGVHESTMSFLLNDGSIVITVTPQPDSLKDAFRLLKGIKNRSFQQTVNVLINIVAGEVEAKKIIARLSIAVRNFLGDQCGTLSYFILDDFILGCLNQKRAITVEYPDSLPGFCCRNIASRLVEPDAEQGNIIPARDGQIVTESPAIIEVKEPQPEENWIDKALEAVKTYPLDEMEPIMQQLNEVWQQRKFIEHDHKNRPSVFEVELLKLKTAIHFAGQLADRTKAD